MFLGLNAFSHDASAALVTRGGTVVAAVEEERFTRAKKESRFPIDAIRYCLKTAGIEAHQLDAVAIAWAPRLILRHRIMNGRRNEVPLRFQRKDFEKLQSLRGAHALFEQSIGPLGRGVRVGFVRHHLAHAASAVYGSPFERCAFLTMDGRGEHESATWGTFAGARLSGLGALHHPDSLGNFYSAIARFCGFRGHELEGTAMALAGCGRPRLVDEMRQILSGSDHRADAVHVDTSLIDGRSGRAFPLPALAERLGFPERDRDDDDPMPYADIAASAQAVLEEKILALAGIIREKSGADSISLAGGVALNSVSNGRLCAEGPFPHVYIQPASHDAGTALGAALLLANRNRPDRLPPPARMPYYGPEYSRDEIRRELEATPDVQWDEPAQLAEVAASRLAKGEIVAWFQGRLEFGPRALGNRSLLADPRSHEMVARLNSLKGRQGFRPFAVTILATERQGWLQHGFNSAHMLLVDRLRPAMADRVPGAMHRDGSVRTQTLRSEENPSFHAVIDAFHRRTGVPMLINTSLNLAGEPLACSPRDALQQLVGSEIDALAIGPFWVTRRDRKSAASPGLVRS